MSRVIWFLRLGENKSFFNALEKKKTRVPAVSKGKLEKVVLAFCYNNAVGINVILH